MKHLTTTLILLSGLLLTGCFQDHISPNGITVIEEYQLDTYSSIEVGSAFDAVITFTTTEEKIQIEADENIIPHIIVKVENSKLIIRLKNQIHLRGNHTLRAVIHTEHIDDFEISGASKVRLLNTLESNEVDMLITGASELSGEVVAASIDARLEGASKLDLSGQAANFEAEASGASFFRGYDLVTDYAYIELDGASSGAVTINKELSVEASGASSMNFKGNGVIVHQSLSGAATVSRRN